MTLSKLLASLPPVVCLWPFVSSLWDHPDRGPLRGGRWALVEYSPHRSILGDPRNGYVGWVSVTRFRSRAMARSWARACRAERWTCAIVVRWNRTLERRIDAQLVYHPDSPWLPMSARL